MPLVFLVVVFLFRSRGARLAAGREFSLCQRRFLQAINE
jgi:hypothetical protein